MGTSTPITAMTQACRPVCFISSRSVSIPARNMMRMTPISAVLTRKSELSNTPNPLGPRMMPASRAPTTWGI